MKVAGKNISFYGDDTWLKLFPDVFFRHEGTVSFFATVESPRPFSSFFFFLPFGSHARTPLTKGHSGG
jgi:hypothetical protein